MSIKKVGQDSEYHQLSDKKKFLFLPFFVCGDYLIIHRILIKKIGKF